MQLPTPYCVSLIMVTTTSHIFITIAQTVHFSAVQFTWGYRKNNYKLPSDSKIAEGFKIIWTKLDRSLLIVHCNKSDYLYYISATHDFKINVTDYLYIIFQPHMISTVHFTQMYSHFMQHFFSLKQEIVTLTRNILYYSNYFKEHI